MRVRSCVAEKGSPSRSQGRLAAKHLWIPVQNLPFAEVVLYAFAADRTPYPTYVCLPSGCTKRAMDRLWGKPALTRKSYLSGMYFFDGWRVHPTLPIPSNLPRTKKRQSEISLTPHPQPVRSQPGRRRRSERHPSDSRQESGGRRTKYKAGSCPRM